MYGVLVGLEIILSIALIIIVLMQSSKGGGLAGSFGGSAMGTVFGVRRTADFLSRSTTITATIFIVLALIINMFFLPRVANTGESIIQRGTPTSVPSPAPPRSQSPPDQQQQP